MLSGVDRRSRKEGSCLAGLIDVWVALMFGSHRCLGHIDVWCKPVSEANRFLHCGRHFDDRPIDDRHFDDRHFDGSVRRWLTKGAILQYNATASSGQGFCYSAVQNSAHWLHYNQASESLFRSTSDL